eukprot:tig00000157_g9654.t1
MHITISADDPDLEAYTYSDSCSDRDRDGELDSEVASMGSLTPASSSPSSRATSPPASPLRAALHVGGHTGQGKLHSRPVCPSSPISSTSHGSIASACSVPDVAAFKLDSCAPSSSVSCPGELQSEALGADSQMRKDHDVTSVLWAAMQAVNGASSYASPVGIALLRSISRVGGSSRLERLNASTFRSRRGSDPDGFVEYAGYEAFHLSLHRSLSHPGAKQPWTLRDGQLLARDNFAVDANSTAFMTKQSFQDALARIAKSWAAGVLQKTPELATAMRLLALESDVAADGSLEAVFLACLAKIALETSSFATDSSKTPRHATEIATPAGPVPAPGPALRPWREVAVGACLPQNAMAVLFDMAYARGARLRCAAPAAAPPSCSDVKLRAVSAAALSIAKPSSASSHVHAHAQAPAPPAPARAGAEPAPSRPISTAKTASLNDLELKSPVSLCRRALHNRMDRLLKLRHNSFEFTARPGLL